jgi:membrane associated rhomboid family serine protease/Zn-finger nucleic acid-binding protein
MTPLEHQGAHVDHCKRCGGVFLERGETEFALAPEADPENWVRSHVAQKLGPAKLRCPKDQSLFLAYRVAFGGAAVEVDVCTACKGLWLDNFEGPKLRYITEQARLASGPSEIARAAGALYQTRPPPTATPGQRVVAQASFTPEHEAQVSAPGTASYFFQLFTGLPIEVHNPVKQKPVAVYVLLALLGLVFMLQVFTSAGTDPSAFNRPLWLVPVEWLQGEKPWTVLTCTFLHGGLLHLFGNAYFLYSFGDNIEDRLGPRRFLLLYLGSGLVASLLHVAFNSGSLIPCIGASGAIAGIMGAYLSKFGKTKLWIVLLFIRFKISVYWYLGFWIAYQFLMVWRGAPGVAWYAHIGGFFAGLAFAPLLKKRD